MARSDTNVRNIHMQQHKINLVPHVPKLDLN
jgi:hypothetical protein